MSTEQVTFFQRVDAALSDSTLRIALDRTTSRFTEQRARGFASLPNPDAVRDRARAIRLSTIANLKQHLQTFEAAVVHAGGQVHHAATASDAIRIVLDIAARRSARKIVKSKSMISEEIHLNPALERAGLSVIESDLGEYIIQLAGETPSHIIAPAIHKTREQVGQLFHQHLGIPLTDDPVVMTRAARARLRQEFLEADIGITGVNFGVAETGSLTIVTNEGNASLTTTAPVHIAMMGIERIVPTLSDLAVMLQVLARSATGQTLSVYTDIITGPRRREPAGDADGPDELHVVLLDNGRSRLLGTELSEILACIRCGACLNACPVYREIGGHAYGSVYSGPIGAVLMPSLEGLGPWKDLPDASTLCGACREVCPVRIDIPRMLLLLRSRNAEQGGLPASIRHGLHAYRALATRPRLFRAATRLARWGSRLVAKSGWFHRLPGPLSGWTAHRDFPAPAPRSFLDEWRSSKRSTPVRANPSSPPSTGGGPDPSTSSGSARPASRGEHSRGATPQRTSRQ